ncbi:MAG: SKN1 domain-containing protein [Parcubacteria group bacterium GW2011_GWB1_38_8]|nr:MAG: SKN1 domain-containing protein [Parcubacteria group bacterium GW2011_GWB1_38_8]
MMKKFSAIFVIAALLAVASPASAFVFPSNNNGGDINITVDNHAYVDNDVSTKADTGDNSSRGGSAKSRASASGWFSDATSSARGGNGGRIETGNADSSSTVLNDVNVNDISVEADCGCKGDINVDLDNGAVVKNDVSTKADSGDNSSTGGRSRSKARASHGGDATSTSTGGNGGEVETGDADSVSDVRTYVNTNIVRVVR